MEAVNMTEIVDTIAPIANFGAFGSFYNGQVQGGTNADYLYGMNTTGITEDFAFTNTVDIASISSIDQLGGGVDIDIVGYSDIFDIANFSIIQPQGVSDMGIASTTNFVTNIDIGQLLNEVDTGLDTSVADRELGDTVTTGIPADWPANWTTEWSDE
jgi:hypothetical protein